VEVADPGRYLARARHARQGLPSRGEGRRPDCRGAARARLRRQPVTVPGFGLSEPPHPGREIDLRSPRSEPRPVNLSTRCDVAATPRRCRTSPTRATVTSNLAGDKFDRGLRTLHLLIAVGTPWSLRLARSIGACIFHHSLLAHPHGRRNMRLMCGAALRSARSGFGQSPSIFVRGHGCSHHSRQGWRCPRFLLSHALIKQVTSTPPRRGGR